MKKPPIQYTLRDVPERVDARLREAAAKYGTSLNRAAIEALARALGLEEPAVEHHDLDDLAGSWVPDAAAEAAFAQMDQIDPESWA